MRREFLRLAGLGCVFALQAAYLQASSASPRFEVASVKPAEPGESFGMNSDPGRIEYRHFGIKGLVWVAYQVTLPQIVWPAWMANNDGGVYDVSATFSAGTTEEQQHAMLQQLLADRFKMTVHRETRDAKVYALVVSSRGLKIHKSENPPDDKTLSISVRNGKDGFHLNDRLPDALASAPYGITISKLVKYFNNGYLDRVMVDKTGLEGYYDIPATPQTENGEEDIPAVLLSAERAFIQLRRQYPHMHNAILFHLYSIDYNRASLITN